MANSLFNTFGNTGGPFGDLGQLRQQFQQFRQSFRGDPRAEVEKMLQSGRISQADLNQAQQLAGQLMNVFRRAKSWPRFANKFF